jgi:deazaflavin-dependent oxidoreductase (nitroreductase family)
MPEANDFNTHVIEEFRANAGKVGGPLEGAQVLLLHHTGRKTGTSRVSPLSYLRVGDGWAVFGSFAGGPRHPDWYYNLLAEPRATIEVGTDTIEVLARDTSGPERDEIWERQKVAAPVFAEYEVKAGTRVIPVVVLGPAG